jgi:hypothetical protein
MRQLMISRFVKGLGQMLRQLFFLVGKVGLTLLFSMGFGWGWALFLFWSQIQNIVAVKVAVVVGLGIGSGLLARLILQRHTFLFRWLSAWFSLGISLLYMHNLTWGKTGFSFIQSQPPSTNWDGLWQILLGGIIAFGALSVWRKKSRSQPLPVQVSMSGVQALPKSPVQLASSDRKKKPDQRTSYDKGISSPDTPKKASVVQRASNLKSKQSRSGQAIKPSISQKGAHNPLKLQRPAKPVQKSAERPMTISRPRRSKGRGLPIRLVGKEEHRCPYCLALVDSQDPAGVVICSTCHSYHHKSCWDVTGTCQVPHLHT